MAGRGWGRKRHENSEVPVWGSEVPGWGLGARWGGGWGSEDRKRDGGRPVKGVMVWVGVGWG